MKYDARYLLSVATYTLGDLWSKTFLFQTYGIGYGAYCTLMEWSLKLDDKGILWKKPEPESVRRSRARRAKKLNRRR